MPVSMPLVFTGVHVRTKKKGAVSASSSRPATVTVNPGKIDVVSADNKFPTINIKVADLTKPPKQPQALTAAWVTLDFVQHVDAKLQYVNIQTDASKVEDLVRGLSCAWSSVKPSSTSLFNDDANEIIRPVHMPPPNAKSKSTNPPDRSARIPASRIRVDEEGSASHQSFESDFGNHPTKNIQTAEKLQGMFTDYGIGDNSSNNVPLVPVHRPSIVQKTAKKIVPYSAQANRATSSYRPVDSNSDKTTERRQGLNEISKQPPVLRNTSMNGSRLSSLAMSTKDSLDGGAYGRNTKVTMIPKTIGVREERDKREERAHAGSDDDSENIMPSQEKNLSSASTSDAYKNRKPVSVVRKSTPSLVARSNNSSFQTSRPSNMLVTDSSSGYSSTTSICVYKQQANIGNSCYMNSTMQVLAVCPLFVSHLEKAFNSLINRSETFQRFRGIMRWLNGMHASGPVKNELLGKMRDSLRQIDSIFDEQDGKAQQDAEECLTAVLGAISDECTGKGFKKRVSGGRRSLGVGSPLKTPLTPIQAASSPIESREKEGEKKEKKKMPAACDPVDLMEVKVKDVKRCATCGTRKEIDALEHRVHIGMQKENEKKARTVKCVQQLLTAEIATEEVMEDITCDSCEEKKTFYGTKVYVEFGEYIFISFKRFAHDENGRLRKVNTPIRAPLYLEMADFIEGERKTEERNPMDETITLSDDRKLRRKVAKAVDGASPMNKVMDTTKVWMNTQQMPMEKLSQQLNDSIELGEDKKKRKEKKEEDGKEVEKTEMTEEGVTTAREERMEEDGEEKREEREAAGKDHRGSIETHSPSETASPAAAAIVDEATPPALFPHHPTVGKNRLETPATVKEVTRSRAEMERRRDTSTPSRKRGRQRPSNERREEPWLSASSRGTSLTNSEPSFREKKSRLEGRRSDESRHSFSGEVTIIESDDEEEKRRRKSRETRRSGETKPCWSTTPKESPKEKRESAASAYDFDLEEDETEGARPSKTEVARKSRPTSAFKTPLKRQNGLPKKEEESLVKVSSPRRREKSENMNPSPLKSSMEQKGGGKTRIESDDESEEKKKDGMETREEEGMEIDGTEGDERMDQRVRHENVTRRSKRRTMRILNEKKEGEEEDMEEKEDSFFEEGNEEQKKVEKDKEFGSQEGGFFKTESSESDEVVPSTPPDETDEREDKREGAGREEIEDELSLTEEEEDEEERKKKEKEKGRGGRRDEQSMDTSQSSITLQDEKAIFDTPHKSDEYELDSPMMHTSSLKTQQKGLENLDGEVKWTQSPQLSPVKEDGEIEEVPITTKDDVMELNEKEEEKVVTEEEKMIKREVNKDRWRDDWRRLFKDTDPPPPRDHIMFRPVDDGWMRSQSKLIGLNFTVDKWNKEFKRIRAQSNLCKVDTAPNDDDMRLIEGDGNCLFRALAWWVTGSENQHLEMRKTVVGFMLQFPDEFGARMSGPEGQKYTPENNLRMLNDGEWGTQCEIYGAATLLGVDIYTYHESRWKPYRPLFEWTAAGGHKVTRKTLPNERTRYGLYLENNLNLHYDVVRYMEPVAPVSDTCYRLIGTILHYGETLSSGHYVADVYDQEKRQWLHCDDNTITKKTCIEALENAMDNGYVLVYGRYSSMKKEK